MISLLLNFYFVSELLYVVVILVLLLLLLLQSKKDQKAYSLGWLMYFAVMWMGLDLINLFFSGLDVSLLIWKLILFFGLAMAVFALRFIVIYLYNRIGWYWDLLFFCVLAVFFGVITFTDLFMIGVKPLEYFGQSNFIVGPYYWLSALIIVLSVVIGIVLLVIRYFTEQNPQEKKDTRSLLLSFIMILAIAPVTNLLMPMMGMGGFRLANVAVTVIIIVFFYIIYRRNALGIVLNRIKIRTKIYLISLIQFMLFTLCLIVIIGSVSIGQLEQEIANHLESIASARASHIQTYFNQNLDRLRLITSRTQLRMLVREYQSEPSYETQQQMNRILQDAIIPVQELRFISIVDINGRIIASTDESMLGQNVSQDHYFIHGLKDEHVSFEKHIGHNHHDLYFAGPLTLNDELIGIGVSAIGPFELSDIIRDRTGLGQTGEVMLAFQDLAGNCIFPLERRFESQALEPACIDDQDTAMGRALNQEETLLLDQQDYRGQTVIAVTRYIPGIDLGLVAKIDRDEALSAVYSLALILLLAGVSFSALYFVVNYFIARFISQPIENLRKGAQEFEKGNYNFQIDTISQDEVGDLGRSFIQLIESIRKSRSEVEKKVAKQTKEIVASNKRMASQQEAVLNILEDIEEEKDRTEQEKDKANTILQGIGDGVMVIDNDLRITLFNKMASEISGYSAKEVLNKKYNQFIKFVDEKNKKSNDDYIKEAMATNSIMEMPDDTLLIKKDGSFVPVNDSAAALSDREGHSIGCVIVFRDVTKEREVDKMKTEFVSLASHQLRTPLSAIKWFLEMLLEGDAGRITKNQKNYLQQAFDSNERMISLVNDLLNISRIESGRLSLVPKPTDLIELSQTVIDELMPSIRAHNQIFKFIKPKKLPKIKLDTNLIGQVIANLLSNAIKYTHRQGEIVLKIERKDGQVAISVKDQGVGIPQNQQSKVFQKFFRADNVVTLETEGSGLGLYVAKKVVEASGGHIGFVSQEGKGSTFTFTLPLSGSKAIKGEKSLEKIKFK